MMIGMMTPSNHPCDGKDCKDCETCIFDVDLFLDKRNNMINNESCYLCNGLVKNYIGEERFKFNACCNKSLISSNGFARPRVIKANTGPMVELTPPSWCPKKRGVTKEFIINTDEEKKDTLSLPPTPTVKPSTQLTYSEKRERLLAMPKRIEWKDIEEDGVYVIPKILSQSRKVVRVIMKTDTLLRCSEIDEYGKESQTLSSIYPRDIDAVFITKVLRY